MEGILANGFAQGGFAIILVFVMVAIIRGWLVPKAQVDRMEVSYLAQIENWKATVVAETARSETLLAQYQRLMEIVYQAAASAKGGGQAGEMDT
jgi:hypothetical protein